ncbi:hypothetical protein Tco_0899955, partial [Tanacetum coccineum]
MFMVVLFKNMESVRWSQDWRYLGEVNSLSGNALEICFVLLNISIWPMSGEKLACADQEAVINPTHRYNENKEGLRQLLELRNYTNNDMLILYPEDEDVISVAEFVASWITVKDTDLRLVNKG